MTGKKLDEIDDELRRRWPNLRHDLINRDATIAYLAATDSYGYGRLAARSGVQAERRAAPGRYWLDSCPAQQIADAVDLDEYLELELEDRLTDLRRQHAEVEEVRDAFRALVQELLS